VNVAMKGRAEVLRAILGLQGSKWQETGENRVIGTFVIGTPH
jgi:hypothetical protein